MTFREGCFGIEVADHDNFYGILKLIAKSITVSYNGNTTTFDSESMKEGGPLSDIIKTEEQREKESDNIIYIIEPYDDVLYFMEFMTPKYWRPLKKFDNFYEMRAFLCNTPFVIRTGSELGEKWIDVGVKQDTNCEYYSMPVYGTVRTCSVCECHIMLAPTNINAWTPRQSYPPETLLYMIELGRYLYSQGRISSFCFEVNRNCCSYRS